MPLPHDLILLILANLREDASVLRACSLVCQDWTEASQLHLFQRAILKAGHDFAVLLLAFETKPALRTAIVHLTVYASQEAALSTLPIPLPNLRTILVKDDPAEGLALHQGSYLDVDALSSFLDTHEFVQNVHLQAVALSCPRMVDDSQRIVLRIQRLNTEYHAFQCSPLHQLMHLAVLPCLEDASFVLWDLADGQSTAHVLGQCQALRQLHVVLPLAERQRFAAWSHAHLTHFAISTVADEATVPLVLGALQEVRFPSLKALSLKLNMGDAVDFLPPMDLDVGVDLMMGTPGHFFPFQIVRHPEQFAVPSDVANCLETVTLEFEDIYLAHNMNAFFALFGTANRDSVLNVLWHGERLCPCIYRQDVFNDEVIRRTKHAPACSEHIKSPRRASHVEHV